MGEEIGGSRPAQALVRLGDLLEETYRSDRVEFRMSDEEHTRLDYTLKHLVDYVRASPAADDNAAVGEKLKPHLSWLWGVVLSNSIPVRRTLGDARYDGYLRELAWIEELAGESEMPVHQCGNCGRTIPGMGFALCAECQLEGYRECRHCEQRVASTTNPYCDVCAEEIQGGG